MGPFATTCEPQALDVPPPPEERQPQVRSDGRAAPRQYHPDSWLERVLVGILNLLRWLESVVEALLNWLQ